MPKLLCFGDAHLGQGPEYGVPPRGRLGDQDDVLQQIAQLAIDEAVGGVLCAGDVFEGPNIPPEQLDVFARFVEALQGRIPVLSVVGNARHDAAMRATNGLAIFNHIDGIEVHAQPGVVAFAGCAVATLPWVHPGRLIAQRGGGDRDEIHADAAQLLLDIAAQGLEDCARVAPGAPTILLGHWSVSGASLPNGLPVDQLREPVIALPDLEALGFDAIVAGHIHRPQLLETRVGSAPGPIFYVGSPMPLNHGEASTDHGVWILDLPGGASSSVRAPSTPVDGQSNGSPAGDAGSTPAPRFIPIDSPRFVTLDYADPDFFLSGCFDQTTELVDGTVADAIVRVRYRATSEQQAKIDVSQIRRDLFEAGAAVVKVQPEILRADRARVSGVDESLGELDALDLYVDANAIETGLADRMRARTRGYLEAAA